MPSNWYHAPQGTNAPGTNPDHTDESNVQAQQHYESSNPSNMHSATAAFANAYDTSHLTHTHAAHPAYLTYAAAYHPAATNAATANGLVFDSHPHNHNHNHRGMYDTTAATAVPEDVVVANSAAGVIGYDSYATASTGGTGAGGAKFEYASAAPQMHRSNSVGSYGSGNINTNGGKGGNDVQGKVQQQQQFREYYDPYIDNNQSTAYYYDSNAPVSGAPNIAVAMQQQFNKQPTSAGVYGGYYTHQHYYQQPQPEQQVVDDSYNTNNGYEEETSYEHNPNTSNWVATPQGGKLEVAQMMEINVEPKIDLDHVDLGNSMAYKEDGGYEDDSEDKKSAQDISENITKGSEDDRLSIPMSPLIASKAIPSNNNDFDEKSSFVGADDVSDGQSQVFDANRAPSTKSKAMSKTSETSIVSVGEKSQSATKKRSSNSSSKGRNKKIALYDDNDDELAGASLTTNGIGSKTMSGLFGLSSIKDAEYECAMHMLEQFLQVPLLTEFIRPVTALHPELTSLYSKIITKPMDLGRVCRKIEKRIYLNTNTIRLDIWRIFANCVAYHSHSSAKDSAIPSFISVALHLSEFFNALWLEYMLPSEIPLAFLPGTQKNKKEVIMAKDVFDQRDIARQARLVATSSTILSAKCLRKAAQMLGQLVDLYGCVDGLDLEPCLTPDEEASEAFRSLELRLEERANDESVSSYTMADLTRDMKSCSDLIDDPDSSMKLNRRMDRIVGKLVVPLFEAGCRGVEQSSIWGCMAAAVWARENKKKPYWPGIVLGIIAPETQREEWHQALTERNEGRLTAQLKIGLSAGKKKAEQHMKRQDQMSYFLVEFMGTHEFAWVKESDLLDNFDPEEDPNNKVDSSKKRSSRGVTVSAEHFSAAVEECRWAQTEFERQVRDPCGDSVEMNLEDGVGVSYTSLSQLPNIDAGESIAVDDDDYEAQELFENNGVLDYTTAGRKKAKQKAAKAKKLKMDAMKAAEKAAKAKESKSKKNKNPSSTGKKRKAELELDEPSKVHRSNNTFNVQLLSMEESIPRTKKERAAFKVKEILRKIGKKGGVCHSGLMSGGVIDSGLLAMALAFRSAAGEIPDPSGVISKPWEEITVEGVKKSSERCALLRKKIELLQMNIERIKDAKKRREGLLVEIEKENIAREKKMKSLYIKKPNEPSNKRKQVKKMKKTVKRCPSDDDQSQEADNLALPVENQHRLDHEVNAENQPDMTRSDQVIENDVPARNEHDDKAAETPVSSRNEHDLDAAILMASLSQVKVHNSS